MSDWFAVYTKSRQEKVARDELDALGLATFLPLVRELRRWSDRRKMVDIPLFPGYVFLRADEHERVRAFGVKGFVRFVSIDGRPVPVPPAELDAVREVLQKHIPFDPHPGLAPGEEVRLTGGPLRGVTGKLVRRGRHFRLLLAISALGQAISVEIDAADVAPA